MPISPLIPAIIGSIIEGAANQAPPPRVVISTPMATIQRSLPADALFGEMLPLQPGVVQINGQVMPLALATQIRNEQDAIVPYGAIRQAVLVRYLVDSSGTVWRVWILSPAELAAAR